jgi:hypothetical protein
MRKIGGIKKIKTPYARTNAMESSFFSFNWALRI